ncbi:MAG: bifunctional phosphoribosyl-AMP cyclohydrolase/phosphoribosyl-ATP diphosphatase HisIE [Gemmatimonadota bacterium]
MRRETDRSLQAPEDLDDLRFDDHGLLPVVAQDAADGRVLMVAWANREALERSLAGGELTFWSRSRKALWTKGETSGNVLEVVSLHADCDSDTVLARVRPTGPACHTGESTCFGAGTAPAAESTLPGVWATLLDRARERPEGSYTVRLLEDPNLRIKKLGEETAELIQALVQEDAPRATEEAADLLYHSLAALLASGVSLDDLLAELERRR